MSDEPMTMHDQAISDAVDAERKRCRDIVSAARFSEVDQDLRAIITMIEHGLTVEQMKAEEK